MTQSEIIKSDKNGPEIKAIGRSEIRIVSDCFVNQIIRLLIK